MALREAGEQARRTRLCALRVVGRVVVRVEGGDLPFARGRTQRDQLAAPAARVRVVVAARARELADKLAANGPLAVAISKRVLKESATWTEEDMWAKQGPLIQPVFGSEDAKEGAAAFAQKRAPVWKGK